MLVTNLKTNLSDPSFEPSTREERMAQEGRDRYLTRQEKLADRGTAADRDDYASVIRRSLLGVAERIARRSRRRRQAKTKGGSPRSFLKLETIEGDKEGYRGVTVAYITLSTLFNSLSKTNDKAKIATS
jgi:hypothetical protein